MKLNRQHFELILNQVLLLHESKKISEINLRVSRKWFKLSQNSLNVIVKSTQNQCDVAHEVSQTAPCHQRRRTKP
jgi:hypothetical protein